MAVETAPPAPVRKVETWPSAPVMKVEAWPAAPVKKVEASLTISEPAPKMVSMMSAWAAPAQARMAMGVVNFMMIGFGGGGCPVGIEREISWDV